MGEVLNGERLQEYELSCPKKWTGRSDKAYCTETMPSAKRVLFVVPAQHVHRNDFWRTLFVECGNNFYIYLSSVHREGGGSQYRGCRAPKNGQEAHKAYRTERMPPAKCVLLVVTAPRQVDKVPLPLFYKTGPVVVLSKKED